MSGKRVIFSLKRIRSVLQPFPVSPCVSASPPELCHHIGIPRRGLCTTPVNLCGKFVTEHSELVSQEQADDLIRRLRREEIHLLKTAIEHYEAHPDELELLAASTPKPTTRQLIQLSVVNGLPFIGFGFLDNFIMILCGDWIEQTLNGYMCLSTMAAAGLGNTISDVFGIQTASYVERFTEHLGFRAPPLTPYQFGMKSSRRASNLGRILGITIGCLIGMTPLLFIDSDKDKEKTKKEAEAAVAVAEATIARK